MTIPEDEYLEHPSFETMPERVIRLEKIIRDTRRLIDCGKVHEARQVLGGITLHIDIMAEVDRRKREWEGGA